MIEYNVKWQGLNGHQLGNGPVFGELTEAVLRDVYHK